MTFKFIFCLVCLVFYIFHNRSSLGFMYQTGDELESLEGLQLTEGLELPEGLQLPEGLRLPKGIQLPEGLSAPAELENLAVEKEELKGELQEVTKCALCAMCINVVHKHIGIKHNECNHYVHYTALCRRDECKHEEFKHDECKHDVCRHAVWCVYTVCNILCCLVSRQIFSQVEEELQQELHILKQQMGRDGNTYQTTNANIVETSESKTSHLKLRIIKLFSLNKTTHQD